MLRRLIDEAYTRHPCYGSRKMASWLRMQGCRASGCSAGCGAWASRRWRPSPPPRGRRRRTRSIPTCSAG
ncbi:MAG: transposase [Chromatiaceae bacterium]|nr:transposase [Chromatiaceae bacterium]MBP6734214.1 transposase [Chromatiaceae bacterium]MBP6807042.1 transposase [Chromatiaceae bacterium]MBP8282942.1 transposase [Chromatiaceae bacterium]MBP8288782.1 transposase [Chromatiaceae bacterium]